MSTSAINIINELRNYKSEREWFEFKENWYKPDELGEYISALSNSAAYEGKRQAYFVWGIDDVTHEIKGTNFDCNQDVRNEPLKHYLARRLSPDVNFLFEELLMEGMRRRGTSGLDQVRKTLENIQRKNLICLIFCGMGFRRLKIFLRIIRTFRLKNCLFIMERRV